MIDNVNKCAVSIRAIITERDLKSKYLFRTCSVATNLVTSLVFNPIRFAIMMCHFGRKRSSYVTIPFILPGCSTTRSATGDYVAVLECFGQNEEPASRNEEWTRKKLSFVPSSGFSRCNM